MKTETCISSKGGVSFLSSQRVNGRLVLVEADSRVDAMGGLYHRLLELGVIEQVIDDEQSASKFRQDCTSATMEFECLGERIYQIPGAASA